MKFPSEPIRKGSSHSNDFPFYIYLKIIIPSQQTKTPPGPSGTPGTKMYYKKYYLVLINAHTLEQLQRAFLSHG